MARIIFRRISIAAWAALAALTIGAPSLAAAAGIRAPIFLIPLAAVGLIAGALAAPVIDNYRNSRTQEMSNDLHFGEGYLTNYRNRPPLVSDVDDCTILGVHCARLADRSESKRTVASMLSALSIAALKREIAEISATSPVDERMPAYFGRDIDEELRARLARGEFVLIIGDAATGKSRAAYEAISHTLSNYTLIAPQNSKSAIKLAISQIERHDRWVLWLDDLERFLGADGLTRNLLARLLDMPGQHSIIATIRASEHARYMDPAAYSETDQASRELTRDARAVIENAYPMRINRKLSPAERNQALTVRSDPRIADALEHEERYGLAAYLATGPQMLELWYDAWAQGEHPRGAALIAAAVDCRRSGLTRPMDRSLISQLHHYYLEAAGGANLRPRPADEEWEWVTRPRVSTSFLAGVSVGEHDAADLYEVFEYLVDFMDFSRIGNAASAGIPDETLRACIKYADSTECDRIGNTAHRTGRYQIAHDAYQHAWHRRQKEFGLDHPSTLSSRSNLALVLHDMGQLEKAEIEHRSVLADRQRILGAEDPSALTSRSSLTLVLHDMGRLQRAEDEYRGVLEVRSRVLSADHPSTLTTRHNLARVLHDQGRLTEAESEFRAVLEVRRRVLGSDHPNTLQSHGSLARVLHDLGSLDEAEAEHMTELRGRIRLLDAAPTGPTRGAFGEVLQDLGRLEDAEAEQAAELAAMDLAASSDDSLTLISRETFPRIIHALIRLPEAEATHRNELDAFIRVLGADHPNTLTSRGNHARVLHAMQRLEEAEAEHRTVLHERERILGPDHPNTLVSRNDLALVLEDLGRYEDAEKHHRLKFDACLKMLGPGHPNTLTSQANLATIWYAMGRLDDAAKGHDKVLKERMSLFGPQHPTTLLSRANLATVWYAMGRLDDAAAEHNAVLQERIRSLGMAHPGTLTSRANVATVWYAMGRLEEAKQQHEAVLELEKRLLGPGHPSVRRTMNILAALGSDDQDADNG